MSTVKSMKKALSCLWKECKKSGGFEEQNSKTSGHCKLLSPWNYSPFIMTVVSLVDCEIFLQEKELIYMLRSEAAPLCSNNVASSWENSLRRDTGPRDTKIPLCLASQKGILPCMHLPPGQWIFGERNRFYFPVSVDFFLCLVRWSFLWYCGFWRVGWPKESHQCRRFLWPLWWSRGSIIHFNWTKGGVFLLYRPSFLSSITIRVLLLKEENIQE